VKPDVNLWSRVLIYNRPTRERERDRDGVYASLTWLVSSIEIWNFQHLVTVRFNSVIISGLNYDCGESDNEIGQMLRWTSCLCSCFSEVLWELVVGDVLHPVDAPVAAAASSCCPVWTHDDAGCQCTMSSRIFSLETSYPFTSFITLQILLVQHAVFDVYCFNF